jgi:hypothetical protein
MTPALAPQATPLHEFLDRCERLVDNGPAQLLGVGGNADPATVRAAFRALARQYHPDAAVVAGSVDRERLQAAFARLTEAYQALGGDRVAGPQPAPKEVPAPRPTPLAAPSPVTVHAAVTAPSAGAAAAGAPERPPTPAPPAPTAPETRPPDPSGRQGRVRAAIREARGLVAQSDSDGAVRVLHPVVTLAEGHEQREIRLLLARAYLADSRWRRYGITLLREITQEDPECAEALAMLGGVYRSQGLLARSEATLARALVLEPENPEARSAIRAVRAALEAGRTPAPDPARGQGLVTRLFSMRR